MASPTTLHIGRPCHMMPSQALGGPHPPSPWVAVASGRAGLTLRVAQGVPLSHRAAPTLIARPGLPVHPPVEGTPGSMAAPCLAQTSWGGRSPLGRATAPQPTPPSAIAPPRHHASAWLVVSSSPWAAPWPALPRATPLSGVARPRLPLPRPPPLRPPAPHHWPVLPLESHPRVARPPGPLCMLALCRHPSSPHAQALTQGHGVTGQHPEKR